MSNYIYTNEGLVNADDIMHYGVPGMKWGKRKANPYAKRVVRGHAGPGRYITTKRQLAGDKRDLEALNKGQHLSVGLTKKRQAVYDAKDRARLENRIAKNEKKIADRDQKVSKADNKSGLTDKQKTAIKIGAAAVGTTLAVYGTYKLSKFIRNENAKFRWKQGEKAANTFMKECGNMGIKDVWLNERLLKQYDKIFDSHRNLAKTDSFVRAAKNVIGDRLLR
jgi:hypothetical protein